MYKIEKGVPMNSNKHRNEQDKAVSLLEVEESFVFNIKDRAKINNAIARQKALDKSFVCRTIDKENGKLRIWRTK